jgi:hypothetical protein
MEAETGKCARCKKMFPKAQLRPLWRFPLLVLRIVHATPGKEGEWLYCGPCARSQNFGIVFLALLFSVVVVLPVGHKDMLHAVVFGWVVGLLVWLFYTIRRRVRLMLFKRRMAALSYADRERVLEKIPEPRQRQLREYLRE